MSTVAPIALFAYNRLAHVRQTVEALQKNDLAGESELIIFSDGPKANDQDRLAVRRVRDYLRTVTGFARVFLVEREKNVGLADNIIDGVTRVVNAHGTIIVLEDDLITSPHFLSFLNEGLHFYEEEKRVWHISGWIDPIHPHGLPEVLLGRAMHCWGWATWADRWRHFKRDPQALRASFSRPDIRRFNLDGTWDAWRQVVANAKGLVRTWAVFWYATIFQHHGLCADPARSLVRNIGRDGSGTHGLKVKDDQPPLDPHHRPAFTVQDVTENLEALQRVIRSIQANRAPLVQRSLMQLRYVLGQYKPSLVWRRNRSRP